VQEITPRVERPLTRLADRSGIPSHPATRSKIGAMLPGSTGPPICAVPIRRRNTVSSVILECSSHTFKPFHGFS